MEIRTLEETRALLGPAADGLSDADVLALRDAVYQIAQGLVAAYTVVETPYVTPDQRRAGKGLPPQRRPRRKSTHDEARQSSPCPVRGTGSPRSPHPNGAEQ